jgi:hypothetical protein
MINLMLVLKSTYQELAWVYKWRALYFLLSWSWSLQCLEYIMCLLPQISMPHYLIPMDNKRSESTTSESTKTKTTKIGQNAFHFMHLTCHSNLITLHSFNIILSAHTFAKALWQVKNELHIKDTIFLNRGSATVFSLMLQVPSNKEKSFSSGQYCITCSHPCIASWYLMQCQNGRILS